MITWSDQIGSRGRAAWLLLVTPEGKVVRFKGENIPGVVAIVGYDFTKSGKWSHYTYRLESASGVRAIAGRDGWETGRFTEGLADAVGVPHCDTWIEVANALGVTLSQAQAFLRAWRPKEADALDKVDEALTTVAEETDGDFETIAISFGAPTNRLREEGFWSWPVIVTKDGQEIGRITPKDGRWEPSGQTKVLAVEHANGYHGGTISMRLAVPAGAKAEHRNPR